MFVDRDGRILARNLLYGPPDWELKRIAALLAGEPIPPSEEPPRPAHPFFKAITQVPLIKDGIDWAQVIDAMRRVDPERASAVLSRFVVNTWNLTAARLVAEAALTQFDADQSLWARRFLDTGAVGTVSASMGANLETHLKLHNPSGSLQMYVGATTSLHALWDGSLVGSHNQSALVDPGSKVFLSNPHFQKVNLGWGDYKAVFRITVSMSSGEYPNSMDLPALEERKYSRHATATPRNEVYEEFDFPDLERSEEERAFGDAYAELSRELRRRERQPGTNPAVSLSDLWHGVVDEATTWAQSLGVAQDSPLVGKPMPSIRIDRWIQGEERFKASLMVEVSSLISDVVLLDFMFADCPPCRAALPKLSSLDERFHARGLTVVSLCTSWGARGLSNVAGNHELKHPIAVLSENAEGPFAIQGYPTYVLVDRKGMVRWVGLVVEPHTALLEKLLAEPADK